MSLKFWGCHSRGQEEICCISCCGKGVGFASELKLKLSLRSNVEF